MSEACASAAENGHLEVLKYLREEVKAPWDSRTASWAAENGHLHILEYLVERKYDKYTKMRVVAAMNGHLDCLKYLHETAKAPWDEDAVREAHENNHPECVQYLLDNNCPLPLGWRYERRNVIRRVLPTGRIKRAIDSSFRNSLNINHIRSHNLHIFHSRFDTR